MNHSWPRGITARAPTDRPLRTGGRDAMKNKGQFPPFGIPDRCISIIFTVMENSTAFFNHVRQGNLEAVRNNLESHPELLSARDERGGTPLILAAYYDHRDLVRHLIEKGAEVDDKDGSGNTALMGACFKGYEEMAKILMESGADVNARNGMGGTCLIFAVTFNREGIAKQLIAHGADTDAVDAQGHSALYYARTQGLDHLVPILEQTS